MGQIKWYKRDPEKALSGMMGLSLDERGAYNTVLDLIYLRDGKLPDDDRFLAGYMSVDVRVWRRIKARLIQLEKVRIVDGMIHDDMADKVVDEALRRLVSARDAGKVSAAKRGGKSDTEINQNNDLTPTTVATDAPTTVATNKKEIEKSPPKPPRGQGKVGLPEDWSAPAVSDLPPQAKQCARQWPDGAYARHAEAFHSYWRSNGKRMTDWRLTWANRVIAIHDQVMRNQQMTARFGSPEPSSSNPMVQNILRERQH